MGYQKRILLVGFGGAIGTVIRYSLFEYLTIKTIGITLLCNIIGSFALACLYRYIIYKAARKGQQGYLEAIKLFFGVGVLGGFTTFSTISLDVYHIYNTYSSFYVISYLLITFIGGLVVAATGYKYTGKIIEGGQS